PAPPPTRRWARPRSGRRRHGGCPCLARTCAWRTRGPPARRPPPSAPGSGRRSAGVAIPGAARGDRPGVRAGASVRDHTHAMVEDAATGMVRVRRGRVVAVGEERPGAIEVSVLVEPDGIACDALAYPDVTGPVAVGDTVILNTTARHLGLGTGGFHLVMGVVDGPPVELGHPGRTMKLRYTPSQVAVRAVEESHREAIESSR